MSEVKHNIRLRQKDGWSKVCAVRRDVRSVSREHWLRGDGGRLQNGNLNNRRI